MIVKISKSMCTDCMVFIFQELCAETGSSEHVVDRSPDSGDSNKTNQGEMKKKYISSK